MMSISPRARPTGSWEHLLWTFTRLSGLALLLFGAFSLAMGFIFGGRTQLDLPGFMRWMFFPNPNHVVNSNIPDVELGWQNAFWQTMQMLIFFFAATHAFNGLRIVIEDFIGYSLLRPILRGLVFLLWLFALIVAAD